ncbi:hypothetical protein [Phaeobacter gallaeciensis]|uniref:hypothetical protein n=1 Tax=Phaeobacter gallaeciensis TaxID=60890 RepID=UPI00237EF4CE|nr:hypothetical protein [Phaeobacter gallaeciensis]MDE4061371.1 hypothetical protein [Phaeobacter gallaeciensis]MDE4124434.1 hypothetical protein [Phaeobacter gallaeciensis]MDE4128752.1 hypothetical protein [Phaeobacter gallaeciensis]
MENHTSDPHPEWLRQWRSNMKKWADTEEGSPEETALSEQRDDIEHCILSTPAATAEGMAAQIEFALEDRLVGEAYNGGTFDGLDSHMFNNILAALKAQRKL